MNSLGGDTRRRLRLWCARGLLLGALALLPCAAAADDPHSAAPSSGPSTDSSPKAGQVASSGSPDSVAALTAATEHPADSKTPPDTTRAGAAHAPAPPPADQGSAAPPAKKSETKQAEPEAKPPGEKPAGQAENKAQGEKGSQPEAKQAAEKQAAEKQAEPGNQAEAGKQAEPGTKTPAEKTAAPEAKTQAGNAAAEPEGKQAAPKTSPPGGKSSAKSAAPAPKTAEAKTAAPRTPPAKASRETRVTKRHATGSASRHHAQGSPVAKKGASATVKAAERKPAASPERGSAADAPPEQRHASSSAPAASILPAGELSEGDRVAREIQRTEVWMRRAGGVVPRSRNPRAIDLFGTAGQFQQDARSAYDLKQYARAQRLTQAARDYADRATRMIGPATDDPEYVKSVLEHTDDALDRLKDVLHAGDGDRDRIQYESLKDEQKGAWKIFHADDVRGAYAATVRVRDGVLAVLQRLPEAPVSCDAAEKAIKNAEGARESAVEEIGAKPPLEATRRLQQADGQIAKAHALLDHGDCKEALLRAKAAEQQLERAVDAARPSR